MSNNDEMPSGLTRSPFAHKTIEKVNASLETPLLKLLGKGMWFLVVAGLGVAVYAGRAKLQEEISANPVVNETSRRLREVESATAGNSTAVISLKNTDAQIAGVIEKVVTQQQQMTTQLAVVGEQIRAGKESADMLERTLNRVAERLPATNHD